MMQLQGMPGLKGEVGQTGPMVSFYIYLDYKLITSFFLNNFI